MRIERTLLIIGVLLIVLSYYAPMVSPSYGTYVNIEPEQYQGVFVDCDTILDVRILSRNGMPFSVSILDYENSIKALEEGSLQNTTAVFQISNISVFDDTIHLPTPGWYSILITPSNSSSLDLLEVTIRKPYPNMNLLLSGIVIMAFGTILIIRKIGIIC